MVYYPHTHTHTHIHTHTYRERDTHTHTCNALQHTVFHLAERERRAHTAATHCNTLQHIATHHTHNLADDFKPHQPPETLRFFNCFCSLHLCVWYHPFISDAHSLERRASSIASVPSTFVCGKTHSYIYEWADEACMNECHSYKSESYSCTQSYRCE